MKQKLGILAALILSLVVAGSTFAASAKPNVKQNQTAPAQTTAMAKTTKAKSKSKKKAKSKTKMAKSVKANSKAATTKK